MSRWVANLLRQRTTSHWPESVRQFAGAWADHVRELELGEDVPDASRESL